MPVTVIEKEEKPPIKEIENATIRFPSETKFAGKNINSLMVMCVKVGDIVAEINSIQENSLKNALANELIKYIYNEYKDFEVTSNCTQKDFLDFIENYKVFLKKEINSILQQAGYETLEDYVNQEDIVIQLSAFKALKNALVTKCSKSTS